MTSIVYDSSIDQDSGFKSWHSSLYNFYTPIKIFQNLDKDLTDSEDSSFKYLQDGFFFCLFLSSFFFLICEP